MMSKTKKTVFTTCISLVLLLLIFTYFAGKMLTANLSKDFITQKLQETTGYQVNITGDLHWHYALHPSVSIEKITFREQGKTVIQLTNANIGINLIPLLQKRIAISFDFQQWQQNQLHFSNGSAQLTYENNVLTLTDFTANFYQGKINGSALVNLNSAQPIFDMHLTTAQAEMSSLLHDVAKNESVSGKMDMQADLKSAGINATDFIKNLNGTVNVIIKDGKLNTIHLGSVIPYIVSTNDKQQADFFNSLTIHNVITNGVTNTTITLLAKSYRADGNGQINLNTQNLKIKLDAYYTQSQQTKNIAIPIHITGALASPSVGVDLATPVGQFLSVNKNEISNKVHKLLANL